MNATIAGFQLVFNGILISKLNYKWNFNYTYFATRNVEIHAGPTWGKNCTYDLY